MKVALLHDWAIHMRGGEKVLEALAELYPEATLYTFFYDKQHLSPPLQRMKFQGSWLQGIPGIKKIYRWLLPILPLAAKTLRVENADLVISSSHCAIKGVTIPAGAVHICYCHTPMRYIWGFEKEYFSKFPASLKPLLDFILDKLRVWDKKTNQKVDYFISNSENVRKRIRDYYHRDAAVIYPPLDSFYAPPENHGAGKDYYLVVSAFVPYKKVDIVIEAFNHLDRPLLVVGKGPMDAAYRALRKSEKISFLGAVPDAELKTLYGNAKALIFPTEEDFGIVPLEAQACGTPVIAYGQGGALESVKTGIFFEEQTADSIRKAVENFEKNKIDRAAIPATVESFKKETFKKRISEFINKIIYEDGAFKAPRVC